MALSGILAGACASRLLKQGSSGAGGVIEDRADDEATHVPNVSPD